MDKVNKDGFRVKLPNIEELMPDIDSRLGLDHYINDMSELNSTIERARKSEMEFVSEMNRGPVTPEKIEKAKKELDKMIRTRNELIEKYGEYLK